MVLQECMGLTLNLHVVYEMGGSLSAYESSIQGCILSSFNQANLLMTNIIIRSASSVFKLSAR